MIESRYTRQLLHALRQRLPEAVVFKHNDLHTAGVPDFSISREGRTLWFEAKRANLGAPAVDGLVGVRPATLLTPLQWETLRRLYGFAVVYTPRGHGWCQVAGDRATPWTYHFRPLTMIGLVDEMTTYVRRKDGIFA